MIMEPQGGDQHTCAAVEGDVGCHVPLQCRVAGQDFCVVSLPNSVDVDADVVVAGIVWAAERVELDGDKTVFAGGYGLAGYSFSSDEAEVAAIWVFWRLRRWVIGKEESHPIPSATTVDGNDGEGEVGGEAGHLVAAAGVVVELHRMSVRHPTPATHGGGGEVHQPICRRRGRVALESEVSSEDGGGYVGEVEAEGHCRRGRRRCYHSLMPSSKQRQQEEQGSRWRRGLLILFAFRDAIVMSWLLATKRPASRAYI